MTAVQTATFAIRDRPLMWGLEPAPPPFTAFDQKAFQDELDKIAGKTQAGESVLRISWAGSMMWLEGQKDQFGQAVGFVPKPRYAIKSHAKETFGQPVPIRRWVIEENTDPGQLEAMGGKNHDALQAPEAGFYTPWIFVGDHTHCQNCGQDGKTCFGDYKDPGNAELQYIVECTMSILNDKSAPDPRKGVSMLNAGPYVPPEPDEQDIEAREEVENEEFISDWVKVHGTNKTSNQKPQ